MLKLVSILWLDKSHKKLRALRLRLKQTSERMNKKNNNNEYNREQRNTKQGIKI